MDKNKLFTAIVGILLAALSSFLGNVGAGKATNDPQVIKEAIQEGIKAGLVEATKAKEPAKPILRVKVAELPATFLTLPMDATATEG